MPNLGKGGVMEKQKVKIEEKMSRTLVAELLRKMASDLENGRLELHGGEKTVSLFVPDFMPLEIEAKQKENKEKISIEISWRELAAPEVERDIPDLPEEEVCVFTIETGCCLEPGEEVADRSGAETPDATVEMPESVNDDTTSAVETTLPPEETGEESGAVDAEPAIEEDANPTVSETKARPKRRRR